METIITYFFTIVICLLAASTQARPQHAAPSNFVLWNYFPFLQHQQLQMMQQKNIPVMHPINMPQTHQGQYPGIEMYFNRPAVGDIQYQELIASPPAAPSPLPTKITRNTKPTKKTSSIPTTKTTTTTTTRRPTKRRRISVKNSTPPVAESLKAQLSRGIFEMARNIQKNIISEKMFKQTGNGKFNVISPINVAAVLSLLELGAKGQTNQELQNILGFDKLQTSPSPSPSSATEHPLAPHYALGQMLESILFPESSSPLPSASASPSSSSSASTEPEINMAKGIFMQTGYSMRQDYRTSVETIYQSQVTALNFQQRPAVATKFINDWVQKQTNGKIGNILADGIDTSTRMMVAGAVYFKAMWVSSFIPAATSKRPFYPQGKQGQRIMVDTMGNGGEFNYYESKDYDCGIVALPFKAQASSSSTPSSSSSPSSSPSSATTMYIILPNKSNASKLRNLQASLTSDIIDEMISKMTKRRTFISLPKMHLSDTLDLKDVLEQLNVKTLFEGGKSDLSGITEHNQISLDGFLHKIDLTITEAGTEAAAATATHLSRQEYDVEFRVDGPFMFFVRHEETKLPIFYGSVIEPVNCVSSKV